MITDIKKNEGKLSSFKQRMTEMGVKDRKAKMMEMRS